MQQACLFSIFFLFRRLAIHLPHLLLLLFFRLKSTCSLRLWCFTHHATSSKGTSIMVGFVYLLLAYLHATSLLIFYFFLCRRLAIHLSPLNKRLRNMKCL